MMAANEWAQSVTAIAVAVIAAGGSVWCTFLTVRFREVRRTTRETKETATDVQSKVNGRLDQLLESNKRLTDALLDRAFRDLTGKRDDDG